METRSRLEKKKKRGRRDAVSRINYPAVKKYKRGG